MHKRRSLDEATLPKESTMQAQPNVGAMAGEDAETASEYDEPKPETLGTDIIRE